MDDSVSFDTFNQESESVEIESALRPLSPVNIGNLIFGTLRYIHKDTGSTLQEIKKYLHDNSTIDVPARDKQIKLFIKNAVSSGTIVKKDPFRYALPPKNPRKVSLRKKSKTAKKRKKVVYGRKKPKKRKKVSLRKKSKTARKRKKVVYGRPKPKKRKKVSKG